MGANGNGPDRGRARSGTRWGVWTRRRGLLLTNDGDFANLLTHPSHGVSSCTATVRPHATEADHCADGRRCADDGNKTLPAAIHVLRTNRGTVLEMTIREEKPPDPRMCEAVAWMSSGCAGTGRGSWMLQPGPYRELTSQEVTALRTAASRGKATAAIAKNTAANAARRTAAGPHGPRAPKGAVAARKKRGGNRG
ncbi:MAG: hypothetical protein ACLSWY_04115 [Ruthenibacterium lactatiformans]